MSKLPQCLTLKFHQGQKQTSTSPKSQKKSFLTVYSTPLDYPMIPENAGFDQDKKEYNSVSTHIIPLGQIVRKIRPLKRKMTC